MEQTKMQIEMRKMREMYETKIRELKLEASESKLDSYIVNQTNDFCRVFRLPKHFSKEFCFNGGIATSFTMVDWFNPFSGDTDCSFKLDGDKLREKRKELSSFIKGKNYCKQHPNDSFLIITDYGDSIII